MVAQQQPVASPLRLNYNTTQLTGTPKFDFSFRLPTALRNFTLHSMSTTTIKYRAACDHCSATKIKCTQERPACARCRALGRSCHYSRSLRAGKPPRSSQGLNRKLSNPPVLPRQPHSTDAVPLTPVSGTGYHGLPSNITYTTSPPRQPDLRWSANTTPYPTPPAMAASASGEASFFSEFNPSQLSSSSTSPLDSDWFLDFQTGTDFLSDVSGAQIDMISRPPTQQHSPASESKSSHNPHVPEYVPFDHLAGMPATPSTLGMPITNTDRCARLATETLNQLYEISSVQAVTKSNHPVHDQVLNTASNAVQACRDLLSGEHANAPDFHLPMLIVTIVSKILSCYQIIVAVRDPCTELSPSGNGTGAKKFPPPQSVSMGPYRLGDKASSVLRNHIVHGQLQRLSDVVGQFHSQFCREAMLSQMGEGGRLYASMGGYLKARLQFTLQEVEARLRNGA